MKKKEVALAIFLLTGLTLQAQERVTPVSYTHLDVYKRQHKERAVWRYKMFPLMGLDMTDEHDEVTPLSKYAQQALSRPEPEMCIRDRIKAAQR